MKLAHTVFFTLNDNSDSCCEALLAAATKYLQPHAGIESFAVGRRHTDMQRAVNDQEFDVALQIVFDDQAAHDAYQVSAAHAEFIQDQKENWKQVRVFDSVVA